MLGYETKITLNFLGMCGLQSVQINVFKLIISVHEEELLTVPG